MAQIVDRHNIISGLYVFKTTDSNKWIARMRIDKKWIQKSTKQEDKDKAVISAIQLQAGCNISFQNNIPYQKLHTVNDTFIIIAKLAIERLQEEDTSGNRKSKQGDYIRAINKYYIPYFDKTLIQDIDEQALLDFDKWRIKLLGRVPAKSTVNTHNTALARIFDESVIRKVITHTEIPRIKNNGAQGTRREAFTAEQLTLLYSEKKGQSWWGKGRKKVSHDTIFLLYWYVKFALNTGARTGTEIESITWGDIHKRKLNGAMYTTVTIRKGKTTKYTGTREIICKAEAEEALAVLRATNEHTGDKDLVFVLPNGDKTNELSANFTKRLKKLNLYNTEHGKHTLYSLRHTYITNQIIDKVPLHIIATQCGTSEKMIQEHYSHVMPIMFARELANTDNDILRLIEE